MSGYLCFEKTGIAPIDSLLEQLEDAGRIFHHTGEWSEPLDFFNGASCDDLIEEKIKALAEAWNTRASKDSARLEWMVKHSVQLYRSIHDGKYRAVGYETGFYEKAREAIDAAMRDGE